MEFKRLPTVSGGYQFVTEGRICVPLKTVDFPGVKNNNI